MIHSLSAFFVYLFVLFFFVFCFFPIRIAKDLPGAFQAYMVYNFTDQDLLMKISNGFEWILYIIKTAVKVFLKKFKLNVFSSETVSTKQNTQIKLFFIWTKKFDFRLSALVFKGEPASKSNYFVLCCAFSDLLGVCHLPIFKKIFMKRISEAFYTYW